MRGAQSGLHIGGGLGAAIPLIGATGNRLDAPLV